MKRTRETWVDLTKVLACVLVALGHFFQGLAGADIIGVSAVYTWFKQTIYYFHVPLFFLCSGYLYQKGAPVKSFKDWKANVVKKLVVLGVPFAVFSCLSWGLKMVFAAEVNNPAGDLLQILFIHPSSPYWYLYTLFFMFLITPTMNNKGAAFAIGAMAAGVKWVALNWSTTNIFAVSSLMNHEIWFVLGMVIAFVDLPKLLRKQRNMQFVGLIMSVLFVAGSVAVYSRRLNSNILTFMFGIFGCSAAVITAITAKFSDETKKTFQSLADYTMPVFLMHTIFAAGLRSVLLKFGVTNATIHIAAGLFISFAGPVLVGFVLKKLKWAEFILYPGKFIKFKADKEVQKHGRKA